MRGKTANAETSDYYSILEIGSLATPEEIKAAWKRKQREVHPDLNIGDEEKANRMSQRVNNAYEVLRNPERREVYDSSRAGRDITAGIITLIRKEDKQGLNLIVTSTEFKEEDRIKAGIAYVNLEEDMYVLMKEVYSGQLPSEVKEAALDKYIEKTDDAFLLGGIAKHFTFSDNIRLKAGIKYIGKIDDWEELKKTVQNETIHNSIKEFTAFMEMDIWGGQEYTDYLYNLISNGGFCETARIYLGLWWVELEELRENLFECQYCSDFPIPIKVASAMKYAQEIETDVLALDMCNTAENQALQIAAGLRYVDLQKDIFQLDEMTKGNYPKIVLENAEKKRDGQEIKGLHSKYQVYLSKHGTRLKPPVLQRKIEKMKREK